jgi:mRNA interferase MazF
MEVCQGDIYWVEIAQEETRGSEQWGRRPVIVVSRTAVNKTVKTVIIVPMSTTVANQPPYRIVIPVAEITRDVLYKGQLAPQSVAKTDQVRVIDKSRLGERIGRLSQTATLSVSLGLNYVFDIR